MVTTHHQHRRQSSIGGSSTSPRPDPMTMSSHRQQQQQQQRPSLRPNNRPAASPRRASGSNLLQATSLHQDQDLRRPSAPEPIVPRLSIADQFMSPNYSRVSAATESIHNNSHITITANRSILSQTTTPMERSSSSASGPDPARLTIAEMFTKPSTTRTTSSSSFHSSNDASLLRSPSPESRSTTTTNTTITTGAPADTFDSHINLDLTLPAPNNAWDGRRYTRPFGSQDTLVHSGGNGGGNGAGTTALEKVKKDSADYSMVDYYTDGSSSMTAEDDNHHHHHHHQKRYPWRNGDGMNEYDENDEEVRIGGSDNTMEPRGVWIGCCFMSCGQRQHQPTKTGKTKQSTTGAKQSSSTQQGHPKKRSCSRRGWVFCIFIFFILIVATAYILWPRTPLMRIEGASLVAAPKVTETHQGVMIGNVAFESQWRVNVTVDNRGNRVPTHLTQIDVLAKDALTGLVIGKGGTQQQQQQQPSSDGSQGGGNEDVVLAPNTISTIQLPVWLDYQARDETDITFASLRKACILQPPTTHHDAKTNQTVTDQPQRESLQLHFWITLHIFGLDWLGYKPTVIVTPATGGFACPLS